MIDEILTSNLLMHFDLRFQCSRQLAQALLRFNVTLTQRISIFLCHVKTSLSKREVDIIFIKIRQMVCLLESFNEHVIHSDVLNKSKCAPIPNNNESPKMIIGNFSNISNAIFINWKRGIHNRNFIVERVAVFPIQQQPSISLFKILCHHSDLIVKTAQQVPHFLCLLALCMLSHLRILSAEDHNSPKYRAKRSICLHPSRHFSQLKSIYVHRKKQSQTDPVQWIFIFHF